jgi:FkbM family methyltransferase
MHKIQLSDINRHNSTRDDMIRQLLKTKFIKYLNKKGLTIVPFNTREAQLEKVRYSWLIKQNINSVIDVGASEGGFATKFRGLFPEAKIYSFEPIPRSFKKLIKKFELDKNFFAYNMALGNTTGELEFNRNEHIGASSFLEISKLHKDAHPYTQNYSKIKVGVNKLDNIFKPNNLTPNIILKLDVQGYEIEVLKGAEGLLKHIKFIYSEVCFNKLYEKQPLINEIVSFLKEKGFQISGIENISQSIKDGLFLNADAIFTSRS